MASILEPGEKLSNEASSNPKIPPKTFNKGIKRDIKCSSPSCPNFATSKCSFCELHCNKFHGGKHYNYANQLI